MISPLWKVAARLVLALAAMGPPALARAAAPAAGDVQTTWRLLDYLAVDYEGAVSGGKVINQGEYAEMQEFSATVSEKVAALPANPQKAQLAAGVKELQTAIGRKAAPADVASIAHGLGAKLLQAYPVAMAPQQVPDLSRGAALFKQNCSSCHGATGAADTPMARKLDPPPVNFTDHQRASKRSPFALYQVIDQGLEGTAMASFADMPADDKWALAFYAGGLSYADDQAREGARIWAGDPNVRQLIPNLEALSGMSEEAFAAKIGTDRAAAVIAYLRGKPADLAAQPATLDLARQKLRDSVAAYEAGDRDKARELALSAYLDGFEPIEPTLAGRDSSLLARVEAAMGKLRSAIASKRPAEEVRAQAEEIDGLFAETEKVLGGNQDSVSAFVGGFTILLREGLEALLIVVAMLAFLGKADRREMQRPVHYGWITALVAGGLTWLAATQLIQISGASRELTEGFGSILAAVVLLFVGIWMHGKAQAGEWQRYIREKLTEALSRKSAWFLFSLAFIAVYREVFETILFYAAMASEGNAGALAAGGIAAVAVLAAIAVAMLRFSQKLPIGKFFAFSSALVAVLAVVLAGKGVAALQEAGLIGIFTVPGAPRISMLGLFPTVQSLAAQTATLIILMGGFAWNRRSPSPARA